MENTGKFLVDEDIMPIWYVAIGKKYLGPFTMAEVVDKITARELTWQHFAWKKGQNEWMRVCDINEFQAQPRPAAQVTAPKVKKAEPRKAPAAAARAPAPPPKMPTVEESPREWFLYYNDAQFGPFSADEIRRFLKVGKIHREVHAWKEDMADWKKLEKISEFADDLAPAKKTAKAPPPPQAAKKAADKRGTPRKPIIAKIVMANDDSVVVGICRDISVGGMQVLTDHVPGGPGMRIRLNVSMASEAAGVKIQPFVAEGQIVRILEDGRGFSFRFEKLPETSRRIIETYVQASG